MNIEESIVNIQNELKKQGYAEKSIDYKELQDLHRSYGNDMDEKTFAQKVLQVSYSSYMRIKNSPANSGIRVKVLKGSLTVLKEEKVKEIQNMLRQQGDVEKSIDYKELQDLHKTYGNDISERVFAQEILELSYGHYNNVKNLNTRAIILKSLLGKTELTKEEIEEIQEKLKKQGYIEKSIDYKELQNIHKTYGNGINEGTFAREVLQVSYGSYIRIKNSVENSGIRVRILKGSLRVLTDEQIKEIQNELKKQQYEGKSINYEELKKLHKFYGKDMQEKVFAQEVLRNILY